MNAAIQFMDGQITFTADQRGDGGADRACRLPLLGWFVTRTDAGLGMRAAAEDLGAAHLVGLDVNRLIVVAFAIASAFAGLAGVLWAAQSGIVEPDMGFTPLLKAFVAAIIGGFGSHRRRACSAATCWARSRSSSSPSCPRRSRPIATPSSSPS